MDRREALKALTGLAGATGMSITPVTTSDVQGVELVIIKSPVCIGSETAERLREDWVQAVQGTALETTRTVVLSDGLTVEFVHR